MRNWRHLIGFTAVFAIISAFGSVTTASAQSYPTRPVTFVVPFAAGGGTDAIARLLALKLGDKLGKPFVIENRAGAGTVIGAQAVANAAPDGYTILMGTSSTLAINATLYKKLPYDPAKDLVPLALICNVPFALLVHPSLPVNSVADLIKLAKEKPGELNYGSGGAGAFHHLMAELLSATAGIKMTHVPYKGGAPAVQDLVAGHIQLLFTDLAPAIQLVRTGKLRALGVTTSERAASAPEIPPLAEVGVPGLNAAAWQMVIAPAGTPKEIQTILNTALNEIVADPEVNKQLVALGFNTVGKGSLDELSRYVASERERWGKVVQQAGVAGSE